MIGFLRRIFDGSKRLDGLLVTVYSRKGCSCCHKAIDLLKPYQERDGFQIEVIDIDTDPTLVEAYGIEIPVVAFDGKVRFKGVVNPVLLERLLRNRAAGQND